MRGGQLLRQAEHDDGGGGRSPRLKWSEEIRQVSGLQTGYDHGRLNDFRHAFVHVPRELGKAVGGRPPARGLVRWRLLCRGACRSARTHWCDAGLWLRGFQRRCRRNRGCREQARTCPFGQLLGRIKMRFNIRNGLEDLVAMLNFSSGNRATLGHEIMHRLARYRYKVFVQELGWALSTVDDLESDEFDHADTLYIVAIDRNGEVVGCGRLLPTNAPYLLGKAFPDLMGSEPLPSKFEIWELSRFAISIPRRVPLSTEELWRTTYRLMAEIIRVAQLHGADRLIAFSGLGNERLLNRMGVNVHRAAPPKLIEGKPTVPFWIEIDQQTHTAINIYSQLGWLPDIPKSPYVAPLHSGV